MTDERVQYQTSYTKFAQKFSSNRQVHDSTDTDHDAIHILDTISGHQSLKSTKSFEAEYKLPHIHELKNNDDYSTVVLSWSPC